MTNNCDKTNDTCREFDCKPIEPIRPRCDIAFKEGVYPNATVYVNKDGCIADIKEGKALVVQADMCCSPVGGGSGAGGQGARGPKGDPGAAATVTIGSVVVVDEKDAGVENVGTKNSAILNFKIPKVSASSDNTIAPSGTNYNQAGLEIVNGIVKEVPMDYPAVTTIVKDPEGIDLRIGVSIRKDPETGAIMFAMDPRDFEADLKKFIEEQVKKPLEDSIQKVRDVVNQHEGRINTLETQIKNKADK